MIKLHKLNKIVATRKKRVGRGYASTKGGHTASFGQKGQKSRGRRKTRPLFTGDNLPQYVKIPKFKGFSRNTTKVKIIPVSRINDKYTDGEVVSKQSLMSKKLIRVADKRVKVLADTPLQVKVKFKDVGVSMSVNSTVKSNKSDK